MSALMQLLDRPIAYQPAFVSLGVGVTGAVLLSQLVYWHNRMDHDWFYKTQREITAETGLTRSEQETARQRLVALGAISEERRGVPAKLYYRVNADKLEALLLLKKQGNPQNAGNPQSRMQDLDKQECGKPAIKNAETPQSSLQETSQPVCGIPANIHTGDYQETTAENKTPCQPPVATDPEEVRSGKTKPTPYQAVMDAYNEVVGDNLPNADALNDKRRVAIKRLLNELKYPTVDAARAYFQAFMDRAGEFYFGKNDRGWRANFDYVIKVDTLIKTKEGSL